MKKILFCLLFTSSAIAADNPKLILETDWLESTKGSQGHTLGARVSDVDKIPSKESTVLEIAIPIDNPDSFDKIEVIGKNSQQEIPQTRSPEWIEDYENGKPGLRLFLKKKPGFEFRLKFIDDDGFSGARQ